MPGGDVWSSRSATSTPASGRAYRRPARIRWSRIRGGSTTDPRPGSGAEALVTGRSVVTDGGSALPSGRPGYLGPAARRPERPERRRGPLWPVLTGVAEEPNRQTPGNGSGAGGSPALGHPGRFLNRELSWLDFGARLLDLVDDDRLPLLERVKFLAIFAEGLDDFFQVRVAGLEDQVAAGLRTPSPDGLSPRAQLAAITARATELTERHSRAFLADVGPALSAAGVVLSDWHALDERDRSHLGERVPPADLPDPDSARRGPGAPVPLHLQPLPQSAGAGGQSGDRGGAHRPGSRSRPCCPDWFRCPTARGSSPSSRWWPPISRACSRPCTSRNTRCSGSPAMPTSRWTRTRWRTSWPPWSSSCTGGGSARRCASRSPPVSPAELLEMLVAEVDVPEANVYLSDVPTRPQRPPAAERARPARAGGRALDPGHPAVVRRGRRSLCRGGGARRARPTPLRVVQRIGGGVRGLRRRGPGRAGHQADPVPDRGGQPGGGGPDPGLPDRQAGHRGGRAPRPGSTSTPTSPGPGPWRRPASRSSTGWSPSRPTPRSRLVVRREGDDVRRYCHLGSGNYNAGTARAYEDLGLFTADPDIGADVGELFNLLSGSGEPPRFRRLLVSPLSMREGLLEAIEREERAGPDGRIVLKTNGLTDPDVIDALYRASLAGVSVDLVVRGRCCLRPGVPGPVRGHPGPIDRRPVPRALPGLLFRRAGRPAGAGVGGLSRPDGAQPRPPGGGAGAHQRPRAAASGGRTPRLGPARPGQLVGAAARRPLDAGGGRPPAPRPGSQPPGSVPNAGPRIAPVSP